MAGQNALWKISFVFDSHEFTKNVIARTAIDASTEALERFRHEFPSYEPALEHITKVELIGRED